MTDIKDPEVAVIARVVEALDLLDDEERGRVLRYLAARYADLDKQEGL
jgi:hypothetical protein